tara:strand:+ start:69 stop:530 length:462 start_codon:yes stop_codon:yes gene_type:complete
MARVYRIVGDNGVYIGSTTTTLKKRMSDHKSKANVCVSKELINPKIELIEECTEEDRYIREQYWIDNTECVNHNKAHTGLSRPEYKIQYRQNNKEMFRMWQSKYEKRPEIDEWLKTPFECPCGGRYKRHSKASHMRTKKHQNFLETQATTSQK